MDFAQLKIKKYMTKLWIDNNLVIRWHPKWPKEPLPGIPSEMKFHHQRLAQAKKESLPVEGFPEGMALLNIATRDLRPGDFIDLPVEVEFYDKKELYNGYGNTGKRVGFVARYKTARAARLKPLDKTMNLVEGNNKLRNFK